MEPNLKDMSDYNKPLGKSKLKIILGAFGIIIAAYVAYLLLITSFTE